jgi:nucleoid-associated protein YgaU
MAAFAMERKKIVLLAAGVMLAGICAAWPFRRPSENPRVAPPAPADEGPILAPAQSAASVAPSSEPPREVPVAGDVATQPLSDAPVARGVANSTTAASEAPSASPSAPADSAPQPPPIAEPAASRAASSTATIEPPAGRAAAVTPLVVSTPPISESAPRPQSWRRHRIQDGDTLAKLAQKYLGDPAREAEIFTLNRDVLADPALLPIGAWLKIPYADSRN